jgi:hypothetical protein
MARLALLAAVVVAAAALAHAAGASGSGVTVLTPDNFDKVPASRVADTTRRRRVG